MEIAGHALYRSYNGLSDPRYLAVAPVKRPAASPTDHLQARSDVRKRCKDNTQTAFVMAEYKPIYRDRALFRVMTPLERPHVCLARHRSNSCKCAPISAQGSMHEVRSVAVTGKDCAAGGTRMSGRQRERATNHSADQRTHQRVVHDVF